MSFLGWIVIAILTVNVLFFGTLAVGFTLEERRKKRREHR